MSSPTTDTRALRRAQAGTTEAAWIRWLLISLTLGFLLLFLVLPLAAVFTEALRQGWDAYVEGLSDPDAWSAIRPCPAIGPLRPSSPLA